MDKQESSCIRIEMTATRKEKCAFKKKAYEAQHAFNEEISDKTEL